MDLQAKFADDIQANPHTGMALFHTPSFPLGENQEPDPLQAVKVNSIIKTRKLIIVHQGPIKHIGRCKW